MKRYFDENAFRYAVSALETDPFHAKERFEKYIEKYPNDYYARAYYALVLTRLCMFDEAEEEYEYIKLKAQNCHHYTNSENDLSGFIHIMILVKIKILAYREDYQGIFDLLRSNFYAFDPYDIRFILYFCRAKLGLIEDENTTSESYRFTQTCNYSEELFREHIKKHLKEYNNVENPNEYVFNEGFPIDKVIEEVKKHIPSDKRLFPGDFDNTYYFKYDNCGKVRNNNTNYFTVIVFHNTTDFITMCPAENCERLPFVDLNYLKDEELEKDKIKVKMPSQIEKFNKRFNRQ